MRTTTALGFLAAAFAAFHAGSAGATVTTAVVPDDFPTVQEALDALVKTSSSSLHIKAGIHQGPVMATQFLNLQITAAPGATIVSASSEPAVTICASAIVSVSGLAISSQSVGLFVNGVGRLTATDLDIDAASHGVVAEGAMSVDELRAMFGITGHNESFANITSTQMLFERSTVTSLHGDAIRIGSNQSARLGPGPLVLHAPQGDGIHGSGVGGTIEATGVTIRDAGDDGVDVSGPAIVIVAATIERPADDGVTIGPGGSASIANSTITDTGGAGIESHDGGSYDSITGCTVTGAGADAIHVSGVRIMDCIVTDAVGNGIFATPHSGASGITGIASNHVENVGGAGIVSGVVGMAISQNFVTGTGGDGIVAGADRSRVQWNTVERTGGDGIVASGDRVQVLDNGVVSATGDGLRVSGVEVYVYENSVTVAGDAGIRVSAEDAYVNDNVIVSPAGDGIVLGRGWSEVMGDTVIGAGGDGISVLGEPARRGSTLAENTIEDAASDGIDIGPVSGVRVAANDVTGCGDCGIRLGDGAKRNRLTRNRAQENGSFDLYESDGSRRNRVTRSNRFRTRHRRGG